MDIVVGGTGSHTGLSIGVTSERCWGLVRSHALTLCAAVRRGERSPTWRDPWDVFGKTCSDVLYSLVPNVFCVLECGTAHPDRVARL